MAGGGFKGAHQGLILGAEQIHRPPQLGGGGGLQAGGPLPGLALDGADALPELGIGLGVRTQGVRLGPQAGDLLFQGLQGLQFLPAALSCCSAACS